MGGFLKIFAIVVGLLAVAGAIYKRIGRARGVKRLPRIGRALNINCLGSGSPTVVLDTGWRSQTHQRSGLLIAPGNVRRP
jgi:hypothetical protein